MTRPPVLYRYQLAMIMTPLLAMAIAAVAYGERAAGVFAAAVTLILWAAIIKFTGGYDTTPSRPASTRRPVFTGEPNPPTLPGPQPAEWKDSALAERVARVAADPRAPEGERAAARAALRRLRSVDA